MSEENDSDGFGLDKAARLEAQRSLAKEETENTSLRLNPAFPYPMTPFDPEFFDL